ncbi:hypothetical protein PILCRDRAFT_186728 [Piloderma croceum F 1598]|uniref:Uncharacterized protein n=1 Tax=Piloderma croceum (strain F 1598) TaxID=765440 RepID=A0A0C3BVG5_PILCF|nr:hypothetical protein PILCRDRAFT_186728 [Piloderma croceum F 1598]
MLSKTRNHLDGRADVLRSRTKFADWTLHRHRRSKTNDFFQSLHHKSLNHLSHQFDMGCAKPALTDVQRRIEPDTQADSQCRCCF